MKSISRSLLISVLIVALAIPSGVAFGASLEVPITIGMTWQVGQTLHFAPMPRSVSRVSMVLERENPTPQSGTVRVTMSITDVNGIVRSESDIEEFVINQEQTIEGGRVVSLGSLGLQEVFAGERVSVTLQSTSAGLYPLRLRWSRADLPYVSDGAFAAATRAGLVSVTTAVPERVVQFRDVNGVWRNTHRVPHVGATELIVFPSQQVVVGRVRGLRSGRVIQTTGGVLRVLATMENMNPDVYTEFTIQPTSMFWSQVEFLLEFEGSMNPTLLVHHPIELVNLMRLRYSPVAGAAVTVLRPSSGEVVTNRMLFVSGIVTTMPANTLLVMRLHHPSSGSTRDVSVPLVGDVFNFELRLGGYDDYTASFGYIANGVWVNLVTVPFTSQRFDPLAIPVLPPGAGMFETVMHYMLLPFIYLGIAFNSLRLELVQLSGYFAGVAGVMAVFWGVMPPVFMSVFSAGVLITFILWVVKR